MKSYVSLSVFIICIICITEGMRIRNPKWEDNLSPEELVKKLFKQRERLLKNVNKIKTKVVDLIGKNEVILKENQNMFDELNKTKQYINESTILLNKTKNEIKQNSLSSTNSNFELLTEKIREMFDFQKYYFLIEMMNIDQTELQSDMTKKLEFLSKIRNKLEDMYYDLKINLFDKFDDLSSKLSSIKTHNKQNGHLMDLYYEQLNSTLEKEKKLNSDSFFKINHLNQKKKLNHKNIIKQIKKKEQFCNKIDDCNDCIENVSCGWSTVMNKCVETNYSEDSIGVKFNKTIVHMFSYNNNVCK